MFVKQTLAPSWLYVLRIKHDDKILNTGATKLKSMKIDFYIKK